MAKSFVKYKQLVFQIIGAAMEVHNTLGYGLLEPVYQEALYLELTDNSFKAVREKKLDAFYKKHKLEKQYFMDMLVEDEIVVELKAVQEFTQEHRAQLCNYLRLTRKPIGLLINFGAQKLQGERWAYDEIDNYCYILDKNMKPLMEYDEFDDENE